MITLRHSETQRRPSSPLLASGSFSVLTPGQSPRFPLIFLCCCLHHLVPLDFPSVEQGGGENGSEGVGPSSSVNQKKGTPRFSLRLKSLGSTQPNPRTQKYLISIPLYLNCFHYQLGQGPRREMAVLQALEKMGMVGMKGRKPHPFSQAFMFSYTCFLGIKFR